MGAYSSEEKFIRGDPEGVIDWIGEEAEAFEEILSDHGDICAFAGAQGVWRRLAVATLKLWPTSKPTSPQTTQRTPRPKPL